MIQTSWLLVAKDNELGGNGRVLAYVVFNTEHYGKHMPLRNYHRIGID